MLLLGIMIKLTSRGKLGLVSQNLTDVLGALLTFSYLRRIARQSAGTVPHRKIITLPFLRGIHFNRNLQI